MAAENEIAKIQQEACEFCVTESMNWNLVDSRGPYRRPAPDAINGNQPSSWDELVARLYRAIRNLGVLTGSMSVVLLGIIVV